ncbi:hypothetical protein [Mesorhizobium sp. L-8-3]|uniref:hypothetical protein n=1 Tax=Mesorhizobium sp. L-8-3 TaxID=2744522 RepID=UPI001927CCD4|nr:hypothetical protein [Mesorhizobium sp. L-8-3]BCH25774.1 hypothetical protein MesoLjLb_55590 [Mesorhizobium sp. L-8-3]
MAYQVHSSNLDNSGNLSPTHAANGALDLNHPWQIRPIGFGTTTQTEVFGDKVSPGNYYSRNGTKVSAEVARQAGFDVEADMREKQRAERLAQAQKDINAELGRVQGAVIEQRGGWQIIDLGYGRADIKDASGKKMNSRPLSVPEAQRYLDALAPQAMEDSDVKDE